MEYLAHYGVAGQKWGRRRYQNEDGSLTTLGRLHYGIGLGNNQYADSRGRLTAEGHQKVLAGKWQDDTKWLKKNDAKIRKTVERQVRPYLKETERQLRQEVAGKYKSGTKSKNYINAYNQRMAEIMNMAVKDLPTPNENAIRFVAKRGSMGVYTALTTRNYNINSLKNGVYTSGRVAYRKDVVDKEWD